MQIGHKMTELEAFEVLSVFWKHPVYMKSCYQIKISSMSGRFSINYKHC